MRLRNYRETSNDVNGAPVSQRVVSRPARNSRCSGPSSSEILTNNRLKNVVTVGTWNVRTLLQTGKLQLLQKELERMRYDIVGISEVRWPGSGQALDGRFLYAGTSKGGEKGVAFLLSDRAKKALMKWSPISERVIVAKNSKAINETLW